jgi:cellulose synthase/poly-beta-1,6-N-acetylglucosamine synthase-like glycosyltransferase
MMALQILFWLMILLVFYTFVGYGLLLWVLVKIKELIHKPVPPADPAEWPEVTLLVAAWNEEDMVEAKVENSLQLDYPEGKLKLMWVTDGSTDATNERLSRYSDRVQVLFEAPRLGKTTAVNRAIPYIKTPIVVFSDANTMLNRDCIKEMVRAFSNPRVSCVAGEKRIAQKADGNAAVRGEGFYWKYESKLKELDGRLYSAMGAAGELYAIRTDMYESMKPNTLLDDFILSMRMVQKGYIIAYCKNAYATETGSAGIADEGVRKVRIAAGGWQSIYRLRRMLIPYPHPVATFQYISHRVLRWSVTPFAFFLLLPLNVYLAPESAVYATLLVLQLLFYAGCLLGWIADRRGLHLPLVNIPYYITFMNINVFRGIRYLIEKECNKWDNQRKGTVDNSGAWERAKRA